RSPYDLVREFWKVDPKNDAAWRRWLHDGIIPDTAFAPKSVSITNQSAIRPSTSSGRPESVEGRSPQSAISGGLEIAFRPDPCVRDGRFANTGWLQELPKPITKLTWDNAVIVSPATADRIKAANRPAFTGGEHGEIDSASVELRYQGRTVRGPI